MTTIQKTIKVTRDRNITLHLPKKVKLGSHKVTVLIEDTIKSKASSKPPKFKVFEWKNWPSHSTFRREDLYTEEGR